MPGCRASEAGGPGDAVSARCLDLVMAISLPPTQKSILRALAWRANGAFRVKATFRDIRADTGYGDSSVRRETEMLVSLGYLSIVEATRGPGAYVVWDIVPPRGTAIMSSDEETVAPAGTASQEYRPEVPLLSRGRASTPPQSPRLIPLEEDSREAPRWIGDLYRLGFTASDTLTDRQIERMIKDFGTLDLADQIERFVAHWERPQNARKVKTWATYGRLRTWMGNALRWEKERRGSGGTDRPNLSGAERGERGDPYAGFRGAT